MKEKNAIFAYQVQEMKKYKIEHLIFFFFFFKEITKEYVDEKFK